MRKVALAAIAVTTFAGIAAAWWLRHTPEPVPEPVPEPASPGARSEEEAIARTRGLVWRDGNGLNFRLKSGEILTLADRSECGDLPCPKELTIRYRFLDWNVAAGGYDLALEPSPSPRTFLPYGEDEVMLVDGRHVEPAASGPVALPAPPPPAQPDQSLSEWLTDIANGRNQGEAPLIAASRQQALRDGPRLILKLAANRSMVLTDDLVCGQVACPQQVFRSFDYGGLSPDGRFHVVEEHWNEANAGLLIDVRNGAITVLLGVPKFSPDSRYAVAAVGDLEWSAPRRLEVWSLDGDTPGIEYSLPAKTQDDTVYEVIGWADGSHVKLRRGPWSSERRSPVTLSRSGRGWRLETGEGTN
ncbi:MAG: hypothetical protein F8N37_17270 [Telmatospirillum sp.]|nr:hypothetical protein [Telmatospirillum sp.]